MIMLMVALISLFAGSSAAVIGLNGTISNATGDLQNVNISVLNITTGAYINSSTTNASGWYSFSLNDSYNSSAYNVTFTLTGYTTDWIQKVMINGSNYTIDKTLVPTNNDFDGDGVIDTYDCFKNDASRGTNGGVYDIRYDTNCNGVYVGDEKVVDTGSSSSSSSSGSSSSSRSSSGIIFSVREYDLNEIDEIKALVTYGDVLRISYQNETYDLTLARIKNGSVRFKIGRPINSYFTLTENDSIRGIYLNENYETPGMYVTYYGNATKTSQQIGLTISANEIKPVDNTTDNETDVNITEPEVNITPTVPDNVTTSNETSNETTMVGQIQDSVRSFTAGNKTLQETVAELFSVPLIKIPVLFLLGGLIGLSLLVGGCHMTQYIKRAAKTKAKGKSEELTEEEIVQQETEKITDLLQRQLDAKNKHKLGVNKLKY